MKTIKENTWSVYQAKAQEFDAERSRSLMEQIWLDRFLAGLPSPSELVDVGCGTGEPVSSYLIAQGHHITGVDYAPAMIEIARSRFPRQLWLVQDICHLQLEQQYDGVISWNGFFHLSRDEQRQVLPLITDLVRPGGNLMLTVGDKSGEVTGTVAGSPVYHASLSAAEYNSILSKAGFNEIIFQPKDPACGHHSILLAKNKQR